MSTISPGAATNASMTQNVQHEQRATSPEASGKIVTQTAGVNGTAAMQSFAQRCADLGGTH
jgi:hypothetical protein